MPSPCVSGCGHKLSWAAQLYDIFGAAKLNASALLSQCIIMHHDAISKLFQLMNASYDNHITSILESGFM